MLSAGDVFSWGEGDEGKLGHDNKNSCDRPRVIGNTSKKFILYQVVKGKGIPLPWEEYNVEKSLKGCNIIFTMITQE